MIVDCMQLEQVLACSALDIHDDQINDSSSQVSIDECVDAQPTEDPSGSQRRDTPHPVTGKVGISSRRVHYVSLMHYFALVQCPEE